MANQPTDKEKADAAKTNEASKLNPPPGSDLAEANAANATTGYSPKREVDENAEHILVRSTLPDAADGGHRTALFERDAAHPNGEAFVAGPKPVLVGSTSLVISKLRSGELVEVDE